MVKKFAHTISLFLALSLLTGCSNENRNVSETEKQQFTVEDLTINTKNKNIDSVKIYDRTDHLLYEYINKNNIEYSLNNGELKIYVPVINCDCLEDNKEFYDKNGEDT